VSASAVLTGAAVLAGVGLFFGLLIAVVTRRMRVWEDPRIDAVTEMLPASNCGACGFPGCRAFAEAAVSGAAEPAGCTVMTADMRQEVATYLGVDAGEAVKRVARLLCAGGCDVAPLKAGYRGVGSCAAAVAVAGGGKACTWGCLGLADCAVVCDFDAIEMNGAMLPVVDLDRCTACGDCVEACPRDLFTLMPVDHRLIVQCRSLLAGEDATAVCSVACDACGRCAADAPGVVRMERGLAVVDYAAAALQDPVATARCPTGAIAWVEGAQFQGAAAAPAAGVSTPRREAVAAGASTIP
jgi:Na+-translocating ferredoxin:NAD+ oxidoreductase subunit B